MNFVILGSYFDILGILGIWEKMCSVGFSLVFEFLFCWGILLSRVSFLFGAAQEKKPTHIPGVWWTEGVGFGISSIASSSLGDRKKGYPKRQALWELTLALGRFPCGFFFNLNPNRQGLVYKFCPLGVFPFFFFFLFFFLFF